MMKRVLFVLIFVVIVAAAATGYYWKVVLHPSLNSARLVGTWDDFLDKQSIEFNADNSVVMNVKETPVPGTYTFDPTTVSITVNGAAIHFRWAEQRLILEENGTSGDVFSKRPPASSFTKIACKFEVSGVLADHGGGNYSMPEPTLAAADADTYLLELPMIKTVNEGGIAYLNGPAECVGYQVSAVEFVKDIRLRGGDAPDPSKLPAKIFAVADIHR